PTARQGGTMSADVRDLFRQASEAFGRRVQAVGDEQWHLPTPCTDWDVRVLVNHLVGENLWMPSMFEGKTVQDVGDRFAGDVLGADPKRAWDDSAPPAIEAVQG